MSAVHDAPPKHKDCGFGMSNYSSFLVSLFESGQVTLVSDQPPSKEDLEQGKELLRQFEVLYRDDMPGQPPSFDVQAASWAACLAYRTCQFILYRDLPADQIRHELSSPCPHPLSFSVIYSVDVIFRFFPDFYRFSQNTSPQDPVSAAILNWSRQWPLSSVGIPDVGEVSIDSFAEDASLFTLYVDRIVQWQDTSRTPDPRVQQKLREIAGTYDQLVGKLLT